MLAGPASITVEKAYNNNYCKLFRLLLNLKRSIGLIINPIECFSSIQKVAIHWALMFSVVSFKTIVHIVVELFAKL